MHGCVVVVALFLQVVGQIARLSGMAAAVIGVRVNEAFPDASRVFRLLWIALVTQANSGAIAPRATGA